MHKSNRAFVASASFLLVLLTTATTARAQTFTSLYSFCSQTNCADGYVPSVGLIQANDGGLYGVTGGGGTVGYGTVFEITTKGSYTPLYSFCSQSGCADGAASGAALVQGTDGNLYGTTVYGGNTSSFCQLGEGCGTVFKISQGGSLTTLVTFDGSDGDEPAAALIQATDGNFYGTTGFGGAYGGGTVFEMTSSGTLATLHSFCERFPCTGGLLPYGLLQGTDGNFYGITDEGGTGNGCGNYPPEGCGTVFKMTPSGRTSVLYNFCKISGCPDGAGAQGSLVQASDGNFYGAAAGGGANGWGTVFRVTPKGVLTTLYNFCSQNNCADGAEPRAGLILGTDGNLYGTTSLGGAYYNAYLQTGGTIFKITRAGVLTTLYSFCAQNTCPDGNQPLAPLVQDTNGELYGTTIFGGTGTACGLPGCGTLFSVSVGLGEFVEPEPSAGTVGTAVNILGTAVAGTTAVSFNGTPATFSVKSTSLITTTVPAGAKTGEIEVTTPHGTLKSNVPFRVIQ